MKGNTRFLLVVLCAAVVMMAASVTHCEAANLLVNPGFEDGAVSDSPGQTGLQFGWNYVSGGGYFRPETVLGPVVDNGQTFIHGGAEAQDTCGDTYAGDMNTLLAQRHPVTPGTWYVASAYVFAREMIEGAGLGSGANDYAGVRIIEYDASGTLVVDRGLAAIYQVTTGFVQVSQTFKTEANTANVDFILDTLVNNANGYWGGRVIYDDCVLEETTPPAVEMPAFLPDGGTYATAQTVTITCTTAGATIYYTTDGSTPTESSTLYTVPITVNHSITLKAVAFKSGVASAVKTANYVIPVGTPSFAPDGGVYSSTQNVTITSTTAGATIYYTTDGTDPTESSLLYAVPVVVDHNMRLKARAYYLGGASGMKTADYVVGYQDTILLAACNADGVIEKFSTTGIYMGTFLTGLTSPVAVLQGQDGNVYVGGATGVSKYKSDATLINASLVSTDTVVTGLTWHNDKLWVDTLGSASVDGLTFACDPVTGAQTGPSISWGTGTQPGGLEFGPDGRCYVSFWSFGAVVAWDTQTDAIDVIAQPEVFLPFLAWSGDELYISSNDTTIYKWTAAGGLETWASRRNSGGGIAIHNGTMYRAGDQTVLSAYSLADQSLVGESAGPYRYIMQVCVMTPPQPVESPVFSPDGGVYSSAQTVTMTCDTPGATIHYTLDRGDPTESSPAYTSPITLDHNVRLVARAFKLGVASAPTTADYAIGAQAHVILAAAQADGVIEKFSPEVVYLGEFATGLNSPSGVVQGGDGNVYVGTLTGVSKYRSDGTVVNANLISTDSQVTGLAWKDDKLWLTTLGTGEGGLAAAYDPITGAQSGPSLAWTNAIGGLAFGPDARCYFFIPDEVDAWDTTTSSVESIAYLDRPPLAGLTWSDNDLFIGSHLYEGSISSTIYKWSAAEGLVEWKNGRNFAGGMMVYEGKLYRAGGSDASQNLITAYNLVDKSQVYEGAGPSRGIAQICVMTPSATPMSIADAKGAADGTLVACGPGVVTAVFGGAFYVEDPDRTSGIQARTSGAAPAVGAMLTVSGAVQTDAGTGERYIDATLVEPSGTGEVLPLLLTGKNLGGGPKGLQAGIDGASGLNNIGMLVKATGKVETPGGGVFYLNDGSDVTVKVTGGTVYAQNAYVAVTGIISCEKSGGNLIRVIRALTVTKIKDP